MFSPTGTGAMSLWGPPRSDHVCSAKSGTPRFFVRVSDVFLSVGMCSSLMIPAATFSMRKLADSHHVVLDILRAS